MSEAIDRFALVIGAMKSGTTSLFEYLAEHPAIAPCRLKEPDFFSDDDGWRQGLEGYSRLWDWRPEQHVVALEASTSYTMRPAIEGVPARISTLEGADFRFIYLMRDPIERIESHLSHLATRRGGADRVGEEDFANAVQVSRYAMQLEPYAARWPRPSILPLTHEELRERPGSVVARVLAFLDLEEGTGSGAGGGQAGGRAHNTRHQMAADQALSAVLERIPGAAAIRAMTPEPVRRTVRALVGRWVAHEVRLTEQQRHRAAVLLRDDLLRLKAEWGVDTSRWRTEP